MSTGKRILIIEDTTHLRLVLRTTLEFKGYAVSEAGHGLAGLQAVAEAVAGGHDPAFDLILCDIEMPEMNGLEFVRRFRAQYGTATPVLMLTAEEGAALSAAIAAGADAIIHKPFEPLRLLEELERRLG